MPRTKRDKDVSLTKVKKKTRATKVSLVEDVRNCVDEYALMFVFSIENMRSTKFLEARQHFKHNSRFFFGKNNVMSVALGRHKETEHQKNLHKISACLKGQCGLMFTNASEEYVKEYFDKFRHADYARAGDVAGETVELPEGLLPQFPFSIEPQLRKLGMPTKLEKGQVALYQPFLVCTEGQPINVEQAKILKLLEYKMSEFHVILNKLWQRSNGEITDISN